MSLSKIIRFSSYQQQICVPPLNNLKEEKAFSMMGALFIPIDVVHSVSSILRSFSVADQSKEEEVDLA